MEVNGERCGDLAFVEINGRGYQSTLTKAGSLVTFKINGNVSSNRVLRGNLKALMSIINGV